MHYNPALQDVFIASDKSQFKLSYADQQRVLLTPVDNLDQDAQLIAWDCFKQKLQSAELRPTYSINQTIEQYTEYQKKEAKKKELATEAEEAKKKLEAVGAKVELK